MKEKKGCVQQLLNFGFKPTEKDKEVASIEKYERCLAKVQPLYCINTYNKHEYNQHWLSLIPHELIKYITLRMFDTEESLF